MWDFTNWKISTKINILDVKRFYDFNDRRIEIWKFYSRKPHINNTLIDAFLVNLRNYSDIIQKKNGMYTHNLKTLIVCHTLFAIIKIKLSVVVGWYAYHNKASSWIKKTCIPRPYVALSVITHFLHLRLINE